MKNLGFLSFGHWSKGAGSRVRTAEDTVLATIDLAVAAEEVGFDGAWIRVHHFEQNLASPFPLLAAMAARTSRIELGTGVINMRYENPLYMAELAATADLISGGRLQLGVSRGSPEVVADGPGAFGYPAPRGQASRRGRGRAYRPIPQGHRGRGRRRSEPHPVRARTPPRQRHAPHLPAQPRSSRAHLVRGGQHRQCEARRRARHESHVLHPRTRGDRRAARGDPGAPDRGVPRRLQGGGARA